MPIELSAYASRLTIITLLVILIIVTLHVMTKSSRYCCPSRRYRCWRLRRASAPTTPRWCSRTR